MTDEAATPHRRVSDGRIDKIDHDLNQLAGNVTALQTSVALGSQSSVFISDTVKRLEVGQQLVTAELQKISDAMIAAANDPLATAAGRATAARIDAVERAITAEQSWRLGFAGEIRGTVRLLKFLAAATSAAATVLTIITILRAFVH